MKRCVLGLVAFAIYCVSTGAAAAPADSGKPDSAKPDSAKIDKLDRLLGLARIWAEVKFFHPSMFQRAIDWDGALIKAIPEVEAASDAVSYRAAIARLLATVGDPRTHADGDARDEAPTADWKIWASKDVLVLNARLPGNRDDYAATRRLVREVIPEIAKARVVVIDMRGCDDNDNRLLSSILDSLPATQTWPTARGIQYYGFRSQGETNRDTYPTNWIVTSTGAPTRGGAPGPVHVVFAIEPRHTVPIEALALWTSGHATLVSPRVLDDNAAAAIKRIPLPYGVVAQVRIADIILPGGRGLAADIVVNRGEDVRARAIAIASAIAAGGAPPRAPDRRASTSSDLLLADDDDSPTTGLPSRERRVLAAFRAWSTIEYFHGTRRLDHDWDQQLRKVLPRLDAASDVEGYADALSEMLVPLGDGHAQFYKLSERGTRANGAVYWRRIEGKIVAGGLRDEQVAREAGIALGDELVSVDGVPAEDQAAKNLRTVTGGTEESRRQWAVASLDRGRRGTTVELDVRSPGGKPHHVTFTRAYDYDHNFWAHNGPHYQVLAGNIGYADLTRLTSDEIDAMFDALGKTRAIVFDMRGYPNGTAWLVGARIDARHAPALAEFRTPLVSASSTGFDSTVREMQKGLTSDKPVYRGKVVVLIDDRAISAAEHTCLVFEASSGATFIGSPTSGTNGEETYVRMPGGFEMRFTGQEVFHADGRQLQQIGIQPAITVRPTLRGLRAGKDEVLDRALRYLQTGR